MIKRVFVPAFLFLAIVIAIFPVSFAVMTNARTTAQPEYTLILDAGHGGEDGGALSLSGTKESAVNLAVTRRLELLMGLFGVEGVMLRQEDVSLHSEGANTLREKKVSDLKNRVAAIRAQENAWLISIHQNTFPDPRYSGAQVFYAPTQGSRALAETMQETLRCTLDPNNNRASKPIASTIYLMNHIDCPAVLVECGFLSNPKEERLLTAPGYQTKLAVALTGGFLTHQANLTQGVCAQ